MGIDAWLVFGTGAAEARMPQAERNKVNKVRDINNLEEFGLIRVASTAAAPPLSTVFDCFLGIARDYTIVDLGSSSRE